jgi:hypothetical protein
MEKQSLSGAASAFLLNPSSGNIDAVFRAYYLDTRVTTILRAVTDKYFVRDMSDEIKQDMAVLLLKLLPTLDQGENVYSLLYAIGKRLSLDTQNRLISDSRRYTSLDWEDGDEKEIPSEIDFQWKSIERLDKASALAEFSRRIGYNNDMNTDQSNVVPLIKSTNDTIIRSSCKVYVEPRKPEDISDASTELLRIRNVCGMSNTGFAERLEITHYMLSSYIYGRATIPSYVIENAQKMEKMSALRFTEKTQRYEGRDMSKIMADWIEIIGITDGFDEKGRKQSAIDRLAIKLNINKVTAWRWSQNRARPNVAKLTEYERMVTRMAKEAYSNA